MDTSLSTNYPLGAVDSLSLDGTPTYATGLAFNLLNLTLDNTTSGNSSLEDPRVIETTACMNFKFILYAIAMGVLCILGFLGNTVSFLVLRKDMSTPVASFLLELLAMADNALLVLWLIHYSIRETFRFVGLAANFHPVWMYVRVYTFPLMYMAQMITIWQTVIIALNRYMAVCLPYRAPHLCNIYNVYKGVALAFFFSVFYNVPRFFEIQIIHDRQGNETITTWRRTSLGSNRTFNVVYVDALYYIFTFVLPLLMLAFVNTRVTIAYQAIRLRKRRMTSRRQENENNITLVMIIIVLVFMLCQAPARIVQLVWGYEFQHCETYTYYLIHISNTLEVLNSSVNFLVYFMFRKRFRDIVMTHFCFGPFRAVSHKSRAAAAHSLTTEGLSLVQVEQTTAVVNLDMPHELEPFNRTFSNQSTMNTKEHDNGAGFLCPHPETLDEGQREDVANGTRDVQSCDHQQQEEDKLDSENAPLKP